MKVSAMSSEVMETGVCVCVDSGSRYSNKTFSRCLSQSSFIPFPSSSSPLISSSVTTNAVNGPMGGSRHLPSMKTRTARHCGAVWTV